MLENTSQTTLPIYPQLLTPLPGPKTKALIERDTAYISPSYTRGYPLAIASGYGAMVTDPDGNRFLDFCAGIAVCATGHSHPEVVRVIKEQADKFLHMSGTDFYYDVMADLAERLAKSAPRTEAEGGEPKKVFFANSGTESLEGAMKLARYHTKRKKLISFYRSFHGRTYGTMSLTASKSIQKSRFSPLVPDVLHAHYPYFYRDIFKSATPDDCAEACLDYIENYLFKMVTPPEEVAAFVLESIQGEGGYVVPPAKFLVGLQALAKKYGILIVADEVQSGMGRTGKMWAAEHFGSYEPDIICSAKGLASGLPLGAIIARSNVMDWPPGTHATTFGGNPLSCAAALKTMDLLEGGLMKNATVQGDYLKSRLMPLKDQFDMIGDVRGIGLMLGVEIIKDKASKEKASALRNQIVDECFEQGLVILGCGENTIRFSPPLVICQEQVDCAIDIFTRVLKKHAS
ncbi:MAG: acetyl ornithine aminotransferase family protein [Vampirovibrionales bacterium]|nr:acetyl ornithine aminotransferase family protein [Vampirovibrionales bacterium]